MRGPTGFADLETGEIKDAAEWHERGPLLTVV